jgi:hypothetical protein
MKTRILLFCIAIGVATFWLVTGFAPTPQTEPLHSGSNIRMNQRVAFRIVPDAAFARALPNDARYVLDNCKVYLKNNLGSPRLLRTLTLNAPQGEVRLAPLTQDARPGDQIILEIGHVYRINYAGQRIQEPLGTNELIVAFTLTR